MNKKSRGHITTDRVPPRSSDATAEPQNTAIIQRLLGELEPTMRPNRRIGPRAIKRAIQAAGARMGHDLYVSEAELAEIAQRQGFPVEPRLPARIDQPVRSWWLGVTRKSFDQFLQRHQVQSW